MRRTATDKKISTLFKKNYAMLATVFGAGFAFELYVGIEMGRVH